MLKRTSLAILVAVAGCGDNSPSNFPPVLSVQAIDLTIAEDSSATIDATAADPETLPVSYHASSPSHGTLTGSGPTFTYKPATDYIGSDALTITVSDGENTLEVPVTITITALDDAPVASTMEVSVDRNGDHMITLSAADVDSDDVIFEIVTPPAHGTLSGEPPDLLYTPDHGYSGPDSFTFRASDTFKSSAPATVAITVVAVPVCGDAMTEGSEECDDGNLSNTDGCTNACKLPACGDGVVQLAAGEECDDGNTAVDDGCDASCKVEPFVDVAPVKVSGDLTCTTAVANAARKIAVDTTSVYAVMLCSGKAHVAVSHDRGASYAAPVELSAELTADGPTVVQVATAPGPLGTAYVAMILNTGAVYLRVTEDRGDTWHDAVQIGTATGASAGLSLAAFNDDVYVGFSNAGVVVARNRTRGAGAFETTTVAMSIAFFDLLYDIVQGTLVVAADTPTFHIRASSDGGETFASEVNPPGSEYYSDWAIGNGRIYSSGTNLGGGNSDKLYVIRTSDLTASTFVTGLTPTSASQNRTVAADLAGNAYIGTQLNAGGVQLDRLAVDATAFDSPRTISPTGGAQSLSPLPGNQGAALVFTDGTSVYATIAVTPAPIP